MKSLVVKAYLRQCLKASGNEEIRRFNIDIEEVTSYYLLKEKIFQTFPKITQQSEMTLYWEDADKDYISLSSDSELQEATQCTAQSGTLKIYIQQTPITPPPNRGSHPSEAHPGVTCDGCDCQIVGYRYKCVECPDYDLCCPCERKDIHNDHSMMRISKPVQLPAWMQGMFSPPSYEQNAEQTNDGVETKDPDHCKPGSTPEGGASRAETDSSSANDQHPLAMFLENIGGVLKEAFDQTGQANKSTGDPQTEQCQWPNKDWEKFFQTMQAQYNENTNCDQKCPQKDTACSKKDSQSAENGPGCPEDNASASHGQSECCTARTNQGDSGSLYPSLSEAQLASTKLSSALTQMRAMGFNDEGGWLTSLIQAKDGDINKVLDVLKPVRN